MSDLNIKSNLSADGEYSVEEILKMAQEKNIEAISITDHNSTISSLVAEHIDISKYYDGKYVNGIEIDVYYKGLTFSVLGYGFKALPVALWAEKKFGTFAWRQLQIRNKLMDMCSEKCYIIDGNYPWNSKSEYAHENVFNNLMQSQANKYKLGEEIKNADDFYKHSTTDKNFDLYVDMGFLWVNIKDAVEIIHDNKGKVFLSHPYSYVDKIDVNKLLKIALKFEIDGIEVYYPKHTPEQTAKLLEFAKDNNLLVSGGSGFCGEPGQELATNLKGKLFI